MQILFKELLNSGRVTTVPLTDIRVKLHVPCQWKCGFCHMEGNHFSQPIENDAAFSSALTNFRNQFGFKEVHYTGGEPSIHPQIVGLIARAKSLGFEVKMTTNGQTDPARYEECLSAGLSEINVSLHTLDGAALGAIMNPVKNPAWGERAIARQLALIERLRTKLPVKINTAVGDNETEALKIAGLAFSQGISWRPMIILEQSETSYASLRRICTTLKAVPIDASITNGSSSCRINMKTPEGFTFNVKLLREFFIPSMCEGCELHAAGKCYEYAYGPRIEMDKELLQIRNCVHKSTSNAVMTVGNYFNHQVARDLLSALRA